MYANNRWRGIAFVVTFGLAAGAARADRITPDSIPNPPSAVSSVNGTPVNASNLVTTQYAALGLEMSYAAITRLNGVPVWAHTGAAVGPAPQAIDYFGGSSLIGEFVSPGSLKLTTVSSLSLDIIGHPTSPQVLFKGINGQWLTPVLQSTPGPDGGQVWTFTGPGISWFYVSATSATEPWGVSEVSFTSASAPEPSSLILAGLGALGLAARWRWRRARPVACSP